MKESIYRKLVEEFPEHIRALYINDFTKNERDKEIQEIASGLDQHPVAMTPHSRSGPLATETVVGNTLHFHSEDPAKSLLNLKLQSLGF